MIFIPHEPTQTIVLYFFTKRWTKRFRKSILWHFTFCVTLRVVILSDSSMQLTGLHKWKLETYLYSKNVLQVKYRSLYCYLLLQMKNKMLKYHFFFYKWIKCWAGRQKNWKKKTHINQNLAWNKNYPANHFQGQ